MFFRSSTITIAALLFALASFAQQADFTANVLEGCAPLTVDFTDKSSGSPTSWAWDFGNGNSSGKQHASATFETPGVYDVSLTVSSGGAPSTRIRSAFIIVHAYPQPNFAANISTGCAPLSVKFTDLTPASSGTITQWSWIFGDGGTSLNNNPTYAYVQPGKKSVTLQVTNEFGCQSTKTVNDMITVVGPNVDFTVDNTAVCSLPATFNFTNKTTGNAPLSYEWTFGDSQSSTQASPAKTYSSAGSFTVQLTARDGNNCQATKSTVLYAGSDGGISINLPKTIICVGEKIQLSTTSVDPPITTTWNFGNGTASANKNPEIFYADPGTYTITLDAALLNHTCNSVVKTTIIVAKPAFPSFTDLFDCANKLTLTSTSTNAKSVEWYLDDVLISGAFVVKMSAPTSVQPTIKLIAFDEAGCSNSTERDVVVPQRPTASFEPTDQQGCENGKNLSGCAPFDLQFTNTSTASSPLKYSWNFGGSISNQANPRHVFTTKGLYQVTLTVIDQSNCSDVETKFVIVENTPPVVDFKFDKAIACTGEEVHFTDISTNADYYCWDFGETSSSASDDNTGKTPTHKYLKPGTYAVTLTAKHAGCVATKTIPNAITIKNPYVDFFYSKTCADPLRITLTNKSKFYNKLSWDFGDTKTSTDYHTTHLFDKKGTYRVQLTGTNDTTKCITTAYFDIPIQIVKADFDLSSDKPCRNSVLELTDRSNAAVSWEWVVAGYTTSTQNAATKVKVPGSFNAKLTVKDSDGCIDVALKLFKVVDIAGNFEFTATSTCDEFNVKFHDLTNASPAPNQWLWDFGDGGTSTQQHPSYAYQTPGKYEVKLDVSNQNGTCTYVALDAVNFTLPEPGFQPAKQNYCPGESVIVANTSKNAVEYLWNYGDNRVTDFETPVIKYTITGAYDITLTARDAYGCEKSFTKVKAVIVDKPHASFDIEENAAPCPPFIAKFIDRSTGEVNKWSWIFGDGKTSILQNPTNTYTIPGEFPVQLLVTDKFGCSDQTSVGQYVKVGGPSGTFVWTGNSDQCSNEEVRFSSNTINTVTWRWDFGDGNVVETKSASVNHLYPKVGTYTPSLVLVDEKGCTVKSDNIPKPLSIRDTTAASFTLNARCIHVGEEFKMTGKSEDDVTWAWLVDNVLVDRGTSGTAAVDKPGLHQVLGLATNKANCTTYVWDTVRVQGEVDVIPNVITPNGDKYNESFTFNGIENSEWDIDIVNRWGSPVYREKNYQGSWKGESQPEGVYYYKLSNALCPEGGYRGYITLTR